VDFVSVRIITDDVARLAGFYERATGVQASWPNENFAELTTSSATLAIASTRTVPLFAPGAARPADNNTVIIEFLVDAAAGPDPSTVPGRSRRTARGSARGIALPLPVHDVCRAESCGWR